MYPLSDEAWTLLSKRLQPITFAKGHHLFKSGRMDETVYFMEQGIARAYNMREGKDITFWIGMEGDPLMSFNSYILRKPGYENIELLENCTLYKIAAGELQQLYRENLELANWGRKLAELELIKTEEHFIGQQCKTAEDRYKDLLQNRPELLKRVALMHIASYLGITQVTLSRIRGKF